MPANDFSIGRDVSLDLVDPVLGPQSWSIRTGWESTPEYRELTSDGLDGETRRDAVPNGHRLTMRLDRRDASVENYFAAREAAYFNGQVVPLVTITETIREIGGAVTQFRYTGISLRLTGSGSWGGTGPTTQTVEGFARRKIKVA